MEREIGKDGKEWSMINRAEEKYCQIDVSEHE